MQTLTIAQNRRVRSVATPVALTTGLLGLSLIALGTAVPWITVFRGLEPLPGFSLEGGPLAGVALAAVGLLGVAATIGGGRWLKPLAFVMGLAVFGDAVLLQTRILEYVADPGPAGPLTQPTAGIGAGIMALGAALSLVSVVAVPVRATRLDSGSVARLAMSAALFVAGWIHLLLVPEHFGESTILGLGFLVSGIAQLVLAAVVLWRPRGWAFGGVVAINVTLIVVYAYAVMVGLPFGEHSEHADAVGVVVGAGEPIDWYGAISKIAEFGSAVIAFVLLTPKRLQNPLASTN